MKNDMKNTAIIKKNAKLHFIGIGGIGMSGLAQFLANSGCVVSGSDRAYGQPENKRIFSPLEQQGIKIYSQDGSYMNTGAPDALIYSTAIEEDNPDFARGSGIPRIHRSQALKEGMLMTGKKMIAVTGSCGKTSVTAWLAETLYLLGLSPSMLSGGAVNRFCSEKLVGNFYPGNGDCFVFEADESDKSLMAYNPDMALILNIGIDHYPEKELIELFGSFCGNVSKSIVIEAEAHDKLKSHIPAHLQVRTFSTAPNTKADWVLTDYLTGRDGAKAIVNGALEINLPIPGRHNAANAIAVLAAVELMGIKPLSSLKAISDFKGVWRRFNFAGKNSKGTRVYDDYAHNVDKILSCINAAREISSGRILAVFQPHGYGPFGFMKDELFKALETGLKRDDVFAILPVFYAGGTSSFKPKTEDVIKEFQEKGSKNYICFEDRKKGGEWLLANCRENDVILIMGARDNSLSDWSLELGRD